MRGLLTGWSLWKTSLDKTTEATTWYEMIQIIEHGYDSNDSNGYDSNDLNH